MAISDQAIASAVAGIVWTGTRAIVRQLSAGTLRVRGKRNDVYLNVTRGFPPGGEHANGFLSEFLDAGGFAFDLWMRSIGTWHHKIYSHGVILTVELWVPGPLCNECYSDQFREYQRGWVFRKDVLMLLELRQRA